MYSLILKNCTTELEGKLKGMDTYDVIKTDQDGIELSNIIHTTFHLQDDNKQDIMSVVETD